MSTNMVNDKDRWADDGGFMPADAEWPEVPDAWKWVGCYGPDGTSQGIISEHLGLDGLEPEVTADGHQVVIIENDEIPVLCSELVPGYTEDGPITARCGTPLRGDHFACRAHRYEIDHRMAWERQLDALAGDCEDVRRYGYEEVYA
jgi:hypothetical protein